METMMQSAVCLLEQAAEKFKNKTVFEDKDGSISFEELREKSRKIGSELIKRVETGRKCPVIVYLPKSIKSIISFMGSLYSASPYVPIDYAIPMARMEKTVENLHPTAIITDTDGKTKLESLNLDTEILIFDDATSALDLKTEADLYSELSAKKYDVTRIIIAQRIASVKNADRIVVMDNGRLADVGSHSELIKTSEIYKDIYESQLKGNE